MKMHFGDIYKGEWKKGLRHGKGKLIEVNGSYFDG
jgi:hypothetical protein